MTELDFDELDKAVNSLMAENDTTDQPAQSSGTSSASQSPSDTPASSAIPSPALKRGRFMDIVAPSSTVRSAPVVVKREAAEVTPPTIEEAVTADATPIETPEPAPELAEPAVDDTVAEPVVTDEVTEDVAAPTETDMPSDDVTPVVAEAPVEPTPTDEPLSSPFLADAKVEKRPLGGDGTGLVDTEPTEASAFEEPVDPAPAEPTEVVEEKPESGDAGTIEPIPVPDELHEDVVAIESSEVMHEETPAAEVEVAGEVPSPADEPSSVVDQQPATGGSIMQQYDEQPSSGDQTNGAIFDTSTYHQPLEAATPKKKSSVLTWILWTLVLLILGATAGAAWFYFTTQ